MGTPHALEQATQAEPGEHAHPGRAASSDADRETSWSASRGFRFGLLFALTMTEMMPVALLSRAMPVLLRRSGASMEAISLLSLVMLPWAVKALWAPLVDKLGAGSRLGRYRGWLFITHPLLLLTLVLGAFIDIPALLSTQRAVGIPALVWLSIISATADTASHGLAVNLLKVSERGIGNGVQTAGMMTGGLVGGGMMVVMVGKFGWQPALLIMAALVLLPLFGVAFYKEPPVALERTISLGDFLAFFSQPRIWRWLAVMSATLALPSLPGVAFQTLLVDRGLNLTEIGLVLGILGGAVGTVGGLLGGLIVSRLGRERAFYTLNALSVVCLTLAAVLITRPAANHVMLFASILLVHFGLAAGGTIIYVMIMDRSRGHVASTDYTIQYSLMQLCGFLGMGAGGFIAGRAGSTILFIMVPLLMLAGLLVTPRLLGRADFQPGPDPQP